MTEGDISFRVEKQNRRVITARIREKQIHEILLDHIAQAADVKVGSPRVTTRVYSSTYQEGSLGTSKPEIVIEIIEDL